MCHERYTRRQRQEAEESRAIWREFERPTLISDPEPPEITEPDITEPERAEKVPASER